MRTERLAAIDSIHFRLWVANTVHAVSGNSPLQLDGDRPQATKKAPREKVFKSQAYVCGVYFLERDGRVVYVGQSRNVFSRIAQHMAGAAFEFDSFTVKPCESRRLLALEAKFIRALNPPENRDIPAFGSHRFEVRGPHAS